MYILRTSAKKVISGEEKFTGWDFLNLTKLSGHIQGNAQVGVSIFRYTTVTTYFCLDKSFYCNKLGKLAIIYTLCFLIYPS